MARIQAGTELKRYGHLSRWLQRALDLLFPPRCVGCAQVGTWFCADCLACIDYVSPPLCHRCGRPLHNTSDSHDPSLPGLCSYCRGAPIKLDGVRSVALHNGAIREAIHHLKYENRRELAPILGQLLADCWQANDLSVHSVIPVPLHPTRLRERGYNQATLLARILTEQIQRTQVQISIDENHLHRTRATPPQVGLGVQERKANVQNAFDWSGGRLDGTDVLLVDDVYTTGSTLEACAQALRQAGANAIWALTLARAH